MAKVRAVFRCSECGATAPKWVGRCPGCEEWNTLVEELDVPAGRSVAERLGPRDVPVPISEVDVARVVGRGPPASPSSTACSAAASCPARSPCVGGEPGIGKSTLLLQAVGLDRRRRRQGALRLGRGVQAAGAAAGRAPRHPAPAACGWRRRPRCPTSSTSSTRSSPTVVVVDSIQTVHDPDIGSAPGSVSQVRECAARLVTAAKSRGIAVILVGHVTKEGGLAGPRVLEHVVDTVLAFEGDRHHALRLLRAVKHRFGATDELGLFEMTEAGMIGGARPQQAVPRRPPQGRVRLGGRAHHGGPPAAAGRAPGPRHPQPPGLAPPLGPGPRLRPARRCCWRCWASGPASPSPRPTSTPWPSAG